MGVAVSFDEYRCNGDPFLHERTFLVGKICMHGGTLWVVVSLMSVDAMQCNGGGPSAFGTGDSRIESSIDSANQVFNSANQVLILPIKCLILPSNC